MNLVVKLRNELSSKSLLNEKLVNLLLGFLIYSFTGWVVETIYMSIYHGHIVKRGFLLGPLCVVYGFGSIFVVYILNNIRSHPFLLFICASAITTVVELLAGLLLSKLLTRRLWDYSGDFGNFMGYICVRNTVIWGVMSLFLIYIIHPVILKLIAAIPVKSREIICYSAIICLSLDISISVFTSLNGVNNLVWISEVFMHRMP
ncbi:MAG: putative rane protein [Eubacterium sp.]|jgi:uncharacterized membrane protein|nr:putative rane protein [Eubacterium sp.]